MFGRFRTALLVAGMCMLPALAWAGQPFDAKAFQASQAAGKPILVEVTAPWCPTCKRQRPIVEQIQKDRPGLVVYEVDFDTGKGALKQLRVQNQSTLVVFRGASEVGRSTGDTDAKSIGALVARAF